ncbi:MAG: phage tail protein [Defluviitaleaceae bacterium]|nr:phage tail protein [Defluviitaleaceae bacterium]
MYTVEIDLNGNPADTRILHDPYEGSIMLSRGRLTQALNAVSDFQFDLLPDHPLFHEQIRPYSTLIRIRTAQNDVIFRGRIVDYSRQMSSTGELVKSYIAECELAYLLDSIQAATEVRHTTLEGYLKYLLRVHNHRVDEKKAIRRYRMNGGAYRWVDDVDPACPCGVETGMYPITYASTFENMQAHVLSEQGGYIWLTYDEEDQPIFNYATVRGQVQEMSIELAVNLESITAAYFPSREITRLIPLGRTFERYELAINRLHHIGFFARHAEFPGSLSPDFWEREVQYHRDDEPLPDNQQPISPWTGQLLLGLAGLNLINGCGCVEACREDETDCLTTVLAHVKQLRDTRRPDVNSRMAYNRAVDFLSNSGLIGSSEYWKEQHNFEILELRTLIRLAALTMSSLSPRRGDALDWLDGGDGGWDEGLDIQDPIDDEDDKDDELIEPEQPLELGRMIRVESIEPTLAGITVSTDLSPWIGQLMSHIARLNLRTVSNAVLNRYRRDIDESITDMSAYEAALDSLANSGVLHAPNYWKQSRFRLNNPDADNLRLLIRMTEKLVDKNYPTRMNPRDALTLLRRHRLVTVAERDFWREQLDRIDGLTAEVDDSTEDALPQPFSEWVPELLSSLALINFELALSPDDSEHDEAGEDDPHETIRDFRASIQPDGRLPDINDEGAYYEAVDSLANAGGISSPDYWKEPARRQIPALRWLIRLADLVVDPDDPQGHFPRSRLSIEAVNHGRNWLDVPGNGLETVVEGIMTWDEVNEPQALMDKAQEWIRNQQTIANSTTISALDLSQLDHENYEDFQVGDSYTVHNRLLGADISEAVYPLIEKQVDVVNPIQSQLTFGERQVTMSALSSSLITD